MKFVKLIKKVENKYLNFYVAQYEDKKPLEYYFVSRRTGDNVQKSDFCDAVKVLPYIKETDEIVFIKNFRYAVNNFVYEVPAGLVDENETPQHAAQREVMEEIGAEIITLKKVLKAGFTSVGLTDETNELYFAEVKLTGFQHLDEHENISIIKVKTKDVENFLQTHTCDLVSALMAKYFIALNQKK